MPNKLHRNTSNVWKRQSQNASRRRRTLTHKVYEDGKLHDADVTLIIYQKVRYYTYVSTGNLCLQPFTKEIVNSLLTLMAIS